MQVIARFAESIAMKDENGTSRKTSNDELCARPFLAEDWMGDEMGRRRLTRSRTEMLASSSQSATNASMAAITSGAFSSSV